MPDATAMHLDQPLYECQPDSKAALRPIQIMVGLREEVEHAGQHLRRNSDTGIAYTEHHFRLLELYQHLDPAGWRSELRRVMHKVIDYLLQTRGICIDLNSVRLRRK